MLSKDLAGTIKKIQKLEVEKESNFEESGTALQVEYKDEMFFVFIKPTIDNELVINVVNPISFNMEGTKGRELELANNFNAKAVATKCTLISADKNNYIFSREEIVRSKDIFNKELIEAVFNRAINLVINSVAIFERLSMDEEAGNEQEKK